MGKNKHPTLGNTGRVYDQKITILHGGGGGEGLAVPPKSKIYGWPLNQHQYEYEHDYLSRRNRNPDTFDCLVGTANWDRTSVCFCCTQSCSSRGLRYSVWHTRRCCQCGEDFRFLRQKHLQQNRCTGQDRIRQALMDGRITVCGKGVLWSNHQRYRLGSVVCDEIQNY